MFGNIYGLDLGTYEIKVYDKKLNNVWKEKNAVAIINKRNVFAVGDSAYEMYEKAPSNIEVVFPMKEGVISRFYDMQYLLQNLIKKGQQFTSGSKYIVAVPTDVTEVEKRAFYDLVVHSTAKAKEVRIVERAIADAIGLHLDIKQSAGIFIANFGGEITELSVLSYGGVVLNKIIKSGGRSIDQAIVNQIRSENDYLIGRQTAEELRKEFGVIDKRENATYTVVGRNLLTGIPEPKEIAMDVVHKATKDFMDNIIQQIKFLLERTPPEVHRAIQRDGIYITGGVARLKGMVEYLSSFLGIPVHLSKEPEFSTIDGLKEIIQMKSFKKFTYSMLDDNYRWMR